MGSKAVETYERARVATTATARQAVLESFAASTDNWTRSALVAAATEQAPAYVVEALAHSRPQMLTDFVAAVLPTALPAHASRLLVAAAGAGPGAGALKASIVRAVARVPGFGSVSEAQTTRALETLLDDPETRAGAFAVVAKHARLSGVLGGKADRSAPLILQDLRSHSVSDDRRIDSAAALLAVPGPARAQALSTIAPMLSDPATASPLKSRLIVALGESAGPDVDAVLVTALSRANSAPLFDEIVKRPETALALLAAMQDRTVAAATLSPANVARLRSHPNREVATKAAALFDALSAAAKTKTDIIAALLPDVEKPGDAAKGRALFTGACSGCHKLGTLGSSEVGPPLNGIGSHPRAELLGQIVDPNREVDPSFWQWNIVTRTGQTLAGVVAAENAVSLTLRGPAGDVEIRKDTITSRENTRRSLMPEGFEALGAEALRDILSFLALSKGAPEPQGGVGQTPAGVAPAAQGPKEGGRGDAPLPETRPIVWAAGKTKVLVIGGGSSHDFGRFFNGTDTATLAAAGFSVHYTEDRDQAAAEIGKADVAVISVNRQFFDTPAYRQALFDFAAAGKGLVMLHPGTWYGYAQWPELNATIVGGGARGHDRIARFSVNAVRPDHPVMLGVPKSFEVEDELYYVNAGADKVPAGTTAIEVLAETSPSVRFKQPHPAVWITKHTAARIVGITLGHDERVHDHQAFKTLLVNAVKWAGRVP